MAIKKLSVALPQLTTPTFGYQVKEPSFMVGTTAVTATGIEMNYLVGVTSAIQTQLNAKLATATYTAADVLAKLITVDGAGSGVDADTLDGHQGAWYAPIASPTFTGTVTGTFVGNITGNVTGNTSTATALGTTNFSVSESGGKLVFKYGATTIASFSSAGAFIAKDEVTAFGTP